MPILLKLFPKIEEKKTILNSYKVTITLTPKPGKDATRKENYRPMSPINIDAKILKILANQILQHIQKITHMTKWGLFQ